LIYGHTGFAIAIMAARKKWRKAAKGCVLGIVQGIGFVRQHQEDNLSAQGRLGNWAQSAKLPLTPFCGNHDAQFGSLGGGIVSELPTIQK
jgi:hypothetical protein